MRYPATKPPLGIYQLYFAGDSYRWTVEHNHSMVSYPYVQTYGCALWVVITKSQLHPFIGHCWNK